MVCFESLGTGCGGVYIIQPELIQSEIELEDGGCIEAPDSDGVIRRVDCNGNVEQTWELGDEDWFKWAELF